MKGISLIKVSPKGYVLEFKKKMILQEMRIKKGSKNNKNPSQSKSLEKQIEDHSFCFRFH
ncbi:hypothetical protein ECB93_06805 [Helicobacter pylori]|nr:hypothetical protein ECB91_06630 [Helicobacter pylori]RVY13840.1 hypothetical protein ECB93_06805 [Helicobacter pylori]RVY17973.1 hypothetical protein ECB95_06690 [Helicobacter pylori]RVY90593.1 hypothetical protein EC502_06985 [Helicobacter pylori]